MVKIKIKRRKVLVNPCDTNNGYKFVYDVYHGFTGMPSTFPFFTKWVKDENRSNLTEKEVLKVIKYWVLDTTDKAIIKC